MESHKQTFALIEMEVEVGRDDHLSWRKISEELRKLLDHVIDNDTLANTFIRNTGDGGFEAWHNIVIRVNPRTPMYQTMSMQKLVTPYTYMKVQYITPGQGLDKLQRWESGIALHEKTIPGRWYCG